MFFDNFFTSPKLMLKLLENRIYGIKTCATFSATKWMDNKFANFCQIIMILQQKTKLKVSCLTVILGYNQYMGDADLSNQMKVFHEVD